MDQGASEIQEQTEEVSLELASLEDAEESLDSTDSSKPKPTQPDTACDEDNVKIRRLAEASHTTCST